MEISIETIPEGWFIRSIGENVREIIYRGDTHETKGTFHFELQHRNGGMLTIGKGVSINSALQNALEKIKEGLGKNV